MFLEDLCFNAHQCAEKALKALLLSCVCDIPRTHNLTRLLDAIQSTGLGTDTVRVSAAFLEPYAVDARYPGIAPEIRDGEYREALANSEAILRWVEVGFAAADLDTGTTP